MENTGALTYNDSVKTNKKNEAILGRLEGPCADCISSTRNGRKYSDKLWTKVFSNPIVQETIDNGGIVGEFGHPLDGRTEVEPEKIAIIMPEVPERGKDGLYCVLEKDNDYATIRKLININDGIMVMPLNLNGEFKPKTYLKGTLEFESLRILGPVVQVKRYYD